MVQKRSEIIFWVVCILADKEGNIKLPDSALKFGVMCALVQREEGKNKRGSDISGMKLRQLPLS